MNGLLLHVKQQVLLQGSCSLADVTRLAQLAVAVLEPCQTSSATNELDSLRAEIASLKSEDRFARQEADRQRDRSCDLPARNGVPPRTNNNNKRMWS